MKKISAGYYGPMIYLDGGGRNVEAAPEWSANFATGVVAAPGRTARYWLAAVQLYTRQTHAESRSLVAKAEILAYTRHAMNVTLLEGLVALVPASLLFSGSVVLFRRPNPTRESTASPPP
jgi:hypothetical protein